MKARCEEGLFFLFIQLHHDGVQLHVHSTFHKTFTKVMCFKTLTSKYSQCVPPATTGKTNSTPTITFFHTME